MAGIYKNESIVVDYPAMLRAQAESAAADAVVRRTASDDVRDNHEILQPVAPVLPKNMLDDAHETAQQILDRAAKSGYSQGYNEGLQRGVEESEAGLTEQLASINAGLEQDCREYTDRIRQDCDRLRAGQLELGIRLAHKMIYEEIGRDGDVLLGLLYQAAARAPEAESAVLKVGPLGRETAKRHVRELENKLHGVKKLDIQTTGDNDGLCMIETPYGSVDASVDTQLKKAAELVGISFGQSPSA